MTTAATSFYLLIISLVLHEKSDGREVLWAGQERSISHLPVLHLCGRHPRDIGYGLQRPANRGQAASRNKDNCILQPRDKRARHIHKWPASPRHMQINRSRNDAHAPVKKWILWKNRDQGRGRILRGRGELRCRTNREEIYRLQVKDQRLRSFDSLIACNGNIIWRFWWTPSLKGSSSIDS